MNQLENHWRVTVRALFPELEDDFLIRGASNPPYYNEDVKAFLREREHLAHHDNNCPNPRTATTKQPTPVTR